ncbi:MAG TPA: MFS transporter [Candidatus Limnocylindrales bacterium]|nr:MFS transporter [Candidatus Limnocylindrales bacterium]
MTDDATAPTPAPADAPGPADATPPEAPSADVTPDDAPPPHPHWRRHVSVFIGGQTISLFGSMLVQYAVFWYLTVAYQSGLIMTLAAVFGFLPQAIVSVFAGVWADRTNRKWLIIGADAAIAASTALLALALVAGYSEPWVIFAALAVRSAGAGVHTPAVSALIPQITPTHQLMRVNGLLGSAQSAMMLVAPAAAGGLYAWAAQGSEGSPLALLPVFAIDIVTALTAITLLATIPVKAVRTAADAGTGYFTDLVEGVRYVTTHAFVRWLLMLFAIIFVLTVAPSNLTPLMLVRSFPSGEQGNVLNLAILEMSFSVGMVLGGVLVATLASSWDRIRLIAGSSLVFGVLAIALGLAPSLPVFFAIMALVGLAVPFFSTPSMTLLQETVEPERQGRVFGFVGIVMALAMPFGMLVFGPLADAVPIETILVGAGLATFAVVGLALGLPAGRRAVAAAHASTRTDPTEDASE